ncbi:MAG: FeoB-associated Cys-rich membrane protein [Verrucomicrobia bacterium]|jgi:hypothetical protein|nr:FeoB-associated Cys-rich membrane protein [Verrucomicrobiota bacterium]
MIFETFLIYGIIGVAAGWLGFRWASAWRRRKEGGCAGGCGCASKIQPKK